MKIALERHDEIKKALKGKKVSLVCNSSSLDKNFKHAINVLQDLDIELKSIMGPQHGFLMDKQDNMKESPDSYWIDGNKKLPIYSLYGDLREPKDSILEDIDTVVFDLQDVGSRYYTFIYTMAYVMKACARLGKEFVVFDRPNPINGLDVEGGVVQKGFESFVGLYPISNRHGMSVAELAKMFNSEFGINCELKIIELEGWDRAKYWDEYTDKRSWVMPSPNMPSPLTALVYPGQCLLEATNISEGRGTTIPFEVFGAPFIQHQRFLSHPVIASLEGVYLRPIHFSPTFNKYSEQVCTGFQMHITNRKIFRPLKSTLAIIYVCNELYPKNFTFTPPPYEYEFEKMPIDILLGTDKPRLMLEGSTDFNKLYEIILKGEDDFIKNRSNFLIYV
jgi:uncharacterized protein YbbC (DUF1343 family)